MPGLGMWSTASGGTKDITQYLNLQEALHNILRSTVPQVLKPRVGQQAWGVEALSHPPMPSPRLDSQTGNFVTELGDCMLVDAWRVQHLSGKASVMGLHLKMHNSTNLKQRKAGVQKKTMLQMQKQQYLQLCPHSRFARGSTVLAHRLVCWAMCGPPPDNDWDKYVVMHLCNNKHCLHPHHLHWGTRLENMQHSRAEQEVRQQVLKRRKDWLDLL